MKYPWLYVNYYTFLSTLGRLSRKPGPGVECRDRMIFTKADRLVLFNLAERFAIETAEIRPGGRPAKCPFRVKYLLVAAAFSGSRVRVTVFFPRV